MLRYVDRGFAVLELKGGHFVDMGAGFGGEMVVNESRS